MTFRISVSGWLPMGGTESPLRHRTRQKTPCSGKKGRRPDPMRQSQLRVAHTALILLGKRRSYALLPPRRDRKTILRSSEVCRCRRGEGEEVKRIHALTHWTGRRTSSSNFTSGSGSCSKTLCRRGWTRFRLSLRQSANFLQVYRLRIDLRAHQDGECRPVKPGHESNSCCQGAVGLVQPAEISEVQAQSTGKS